MIGGRSRLSVMTDWDRDGIRGGSQAAPYSRIAPGSWIKYQYVVV
jgi:hypothetical protein